MFDQPAQMCSACLNLRFSVVNGTCVHCRRLTCPHPAPEVVAVRKVNGTLDCHERCFHCDSWLRGVKQADVPDLDAIPVIRDHSGKNPPCVRCLSPNTELHHFAPRALFGVDEAEKWPTAYLCPACHRRWHQTMKAA